MAKESWPLGGEPQGALRCGLLFGHWPLARLRTRGVCRECRFETSGGGLLLGHDVAAGTVLAGQGWLLYLPGVTQVGGKTLGK